MTAIAPKFSGIALVLALIGSGCETPTVYEPRPGLEAGAVAQRPSFTPGDEFWFHTGGTSIMVEQYEGMVDGLHAFRRGMQHETVYYTPDLARVRTERTFGEDQFFVPDDGELDFPLSVGKTWTRTYRVRSESSVYTGERRRACEVLDLGQVTTQAGAFAAYRIACSLNEFGEAGLRQTEILYAPAVGRIVHRRRQGEGTELNLIEYTRAQ